MTTEQAFSHFFEVLRRLRAPNGCPWDVDQTPLSLRGTFVEETFEVVDAITEGDTDHVKEELGDVLLNALMVAYMYEQQGSFSLGEVFNTLTEKLVRRHPHVFTQSEGRAFLQEEISKPDEVLRQWDTIKDNLEHRQGVSILDQVPRGFPPLLRAYKVQKKAAKKGFDWDNEGAVYDKVQEELAEVCAAIAEAQRAAPPAIAEPFTVKAGPAQNAGQLKVEDELGDAFFALVNWSRHLGVDPSVALNRSTEKFSRRFRWVEGKAKKRGEEMRTLSPAALDELWKQAKREDEATVSK
jgi:tetrapyrrole methylase family protein/MazG family protein